MNKEAIISKYISTPAGRARLAASMVQPLRGGIDYGYLELPVDWIVGKIKEQDDMRKYIHNYVKRFKKFDNLRAAIQQACPENETVLDKFLVLK